MVPFTPNVTVPHNCLLSPRNKKCSTSYSYLCSGNSVWDGVSLYKSLQLIHCLIRGGRQKQWTLYWGCLAPLLFAFDRKMTSPYWPLVLERNTWVKLEREIGQEGKDVCPVPYKPVIPPSVKPASEVTRLTATEEQTLFVFNYCHFSHTSSSGSQKDALSVYTLQLQRACPWLLLRKSDFRD